MSYLYLWYTNDTNDIPNPSIPPLSKHLQHRGGWNGLHGRDLRLVAGARRLEAGFVQGVGDVQDVAWPFYHGENHGDTTGKPWGNRGLPSGKGLQSYNMEKIGKLPMLWRGKNSLVFDPFSIAMPNYQKVFRVTWEPPTVRNGYEWLAVFVSTNHLLGADIQLE